MRGYSTGRTARAWESDRFDGRSRTAMRGRLTRRHWRNAALRCRGLGAVEMLLYGKDADAYAQPGEERDFRCGYLRTIATNLSNIAREIRSAWAEETGYPATFLVPGADNPAYLDESEVTLEIAKAFLVGLERLRDIEIAGPLGLSRKASRRTRSAFCAVGIVHRTACGQARRHDDALCRRRVARPD